MTRLARFLDTPPVNVTSLAKVDQAILERYLADLATDSRAVRSRSRDISSLGAFLDAIRRNQWKRSLPAGAAFDAAGTPVRFEAVAQAAAVSRSWLYAQPDIRAEIERLRASRRSAVAKAIPARNDRRRAVAARLRREHAFRPLLEAGRTMALLRQQHFLLVPMAPDRDTAQKIGTKATGRCAASRDCG